MVLVSGCVALALALGQGPVEPDRLRDLLLDETSIERWLEPGVRVVVNLPPLAKDAKVSRIIVFTTPNGNTIEQTLGTALAPGTDWHFDIQHVLAQVRQYRADHPGEAIALACMEAEGLSWPAWRQRQGDAAAKLARRIMDDVRDLAGASQAPVHLLGHSGGGSFFWAFIEGGESIPPYMEQLAWLDANYSFDEAKHGSKLASWWKANPKARLSVVAYDDRNVQINGKNIVSSTGGTYRATERMLAGFAKSLDLAQRSEGDLRIEESRDGRARFDLLGNPAKKILHTALVGEMNGVLHVLTQGEAPKPIALAGPRAYSAFVSPAAGIPARLPDAVGGEAFIRTVQGMSRSDRERAIAAEILRGNVPAKLRDLKRIEFQAKDAMGKERTVALEVMPDYLGIGSDQDWVRMPMAPETAQRIANLFGMALPTRRMVDRIADAAPIKLEPQPLTEARESPATFLQHHRGIEASRGNQPASDLISGIKKDVVVTNRLEEKPNRVAIYGWPKLDGKPIQPLSIVHVNWYVDYSHGIRLIRRTVWVDGKAMDVRNVLHSETLHPLLSDEGPLRRPAY